jgi:RNA polymerase sigma factor (sigma-70 family)
MATTAPATPGAAFPPPAVLGDDALARRVGDGDEQAFEEVYRRYHAQLYRYCTSILGDREEAEEALQSAMFNAYRSLRESRREVALRPWLYRIAHNQCLDMLRRRREAEELSGLEEEPGPRVEEQVAMREDLRQLSRDLAALAPEQRAALMLREMSGLSHAEIATALDATPAGAKQLIHDARRNLVAFESGRRTPCAEVQRAISDNDGRVLRGSAIKAHLRGCAECSLLRESIRERSLQLQALFPPLAPAAGQAVLASVVGGGGAPGGGALAGAGAGGGGLAGGLAAKAAIVAATAVVGTAAVGIPLGLADRVTGGGGDPAPAAAPAAGAAGSAPATQGASAGTGADPAAAGAPRSRPAAGGAAAAPGGPAGAGGVPSAGVTGAPAGGGVAAGPIGAGVTVDPASGSAGAGASLAGGAVRAGAGVGGGSASAQAAAGPASAGAGADATSTSAGATVAAPPVSAGVTAGPSGGGATVEAPGVTVEVPLPPALP